MPRVARHCFISWLRSLSSPRSLYIFLIPLHSVCSIPFSFSAAYPLSSLAFTYVRPIQMAKVNFAITKYLARKSLRYGATHHFGAAATIHGRETPPLDFHGEKGTPYSRSRTHQPAQKGTRNLLRRTNSRSLLIFAQIT